MTCRLSRAGGLHGSACAAGRTGRVGRRCPGRAAPGHFTAPSALRPAPTLRILEVAPGGSAAKAGVQAGDWLALYDGAAVDSTDELRARVQAAEAAGKKTVPVVFFRGAERLEFEFPVGRLGVGLGAQ